MSGITIARPMFEQSTYSHTHHTTEIQDALKSRLEVVLSLVASDDGNLMLLDNNRLALQREEWLELRGEIDAFYEKIQDSEIENHNKERCPLCTRPNSDFEIADGFARYKGFVYLARDNRNQAIKIGYSTQPKVRERTLQSEQPDITFVAGFRGSSWEEQRLHRQYEHKRRRGEWFNLTEDDIQSIVERFAYRENLNYEEVQR